MGFLTSNKAKDDLLGIASGQKGEYQEMIAGYESKSDQLMEETMDPMNKEMDLLRKRRNFRDPLQEFAMQSGVRAQQAGASTKAAQAAGLGGAGAFAQGQIGLQGATQGFQQAVQMQAQRRQMDSQALGDLLKTGGNIKAQMGMSQLQGITGMQQASLQSQAQLQSQAAQMADKPTVWAGFIEAGIGAAGAWAGSDRRLKENIAHVGVSRKGHNIYEFEYKQGTGRRFKGVMADEVPFAALPMGDSGYLAVNYAHPDLDVAFEEIG
tara:strand:- start:15961 stop:16758 length:798 start_codon:yes stop_codon:yes gene_type:complete